MWVVLVTFGRRYLFGVSAVFLPFLIRYWAMSRAGDLSRVGHGRGKRFAGVTVIPSRRDPGVIRRT